VRRCPGREEGRAVALPLVKLGTTHRLRTSRIDADLGTAAVVVENGLTGVV
jgi:hypothetical protein